MTYYENIITVNCPVHGDQTAGLGLSPTNIPPNAITLVKELFCITCKGPITIVSMKTNTISENAE